MSRSEILVIFVFLDEVEDSEPEENGDNSQVFVACAFPNVVISFYPKKV